MGFWHRRAACLWTQTEKRSYRRRRGRRCGRCREPPPDISPPITAVVVCLRQRPLEVCRSTSPCPRPVEVSPRSAAQSRWKLMFLFLFCWLEVGQCRTGTAPAFPPGRRRDQTLQPMTSDRSHRGRGPAPRCSNPHAARMGTWSRCQNHGRRRVTTRRAALEQTGPRQTARGSVLAASEGMLGSDNPTRPKGT